MNFVLFNVPLHDPFFVMNRVNMFKGYRTMARRKLLLTNKSPGILGTYLIHLQRTQGGDRHWTT